MNFNLHLLIVALTLTSCIHDDSAAYLLKESKKEFSKNLTDHFPDEFNERNAYLIIREPTTFTEFQYGARIQLLLTKASKEIKAFESSPPNIKSVIHSSDSCLLIIQRFGMNEKEKYSVYTDSLFMRCKCFSYPIPDFTILNKCMNKNFYLLPDDFTLYVIDAKPGIFMDSLCLSKGLGLPKEWKNGYSKGIAVSKKRSAIIYWLDVW
jgi:hypothetical protein